MECRCFLTNLNYRFYDHSQNRCKRSLLRGLGGSLWKQEINRQEIDRQEGDGQEGGGQEGGGNKVNQQKAACRQGKEKSQEVGHVVR